MSSCCKNIQDTWFFKNLFIAVENNIFWIYCSNCLSRISSNLFRIGNRQMDLIKFVLKYNMWLISVLYISLNLHAFANYYSKIKLSIRFSPMDIVQNQNYLASLLCFLKNGIRWSTYVSHLVVLRFMLCYCVCISFFIIYLLLLFFCFRSIRSLVDLDRKNLFIVFFYE